MNKVILFCMFIFSSTIVYGMNELQTDFHRDLYLDLVIDCALNYKQNINDFLMIRDNPENINNAIRQSLETKKEMKSLLDKARNDNKQIVEKLKFFTIEELDQDEVDLALSVYAGEDFIMNHFVSKHKSEGFALRSNQCHIAAKKNDVFLMKLFLKQNPDLLYDKDIKHYTPFCLAVEHNCKEIVKFLSEYIKNIEGGKERLKVILPWAIAARNKNLEMLTLLLEFVDYRVIDKLQPLHFAIFNNNKEMAELLLVQRNVDINEPIEKSDALSDYEGFTPLMLAVCGDSCKMVELLVNRGANIFYELKNGRSALSMAKRYGHQRIYSYFLMQPRVLEYLETHRAKLLTEENELI